jgi:hypothetical protein
MSKKATWTSNRTVLLLGLLTWTVAYGVFASAHLIRRTVPFSGVFRLPVADADGVER